MANLLPEGKQAYVTSAGVPLVGGKLFTYDAGTTNPRTTWSDAAQTAPNSNPIILDARGEAVIFWSGNYKVQLQDSTGAVIWTVDSIQSTPGSAFDNYSVDSGAVNAYVAAGGLAVSALQAGLRVALKVNNTNTGASTLNYGGLGVKAITSNGFALQGGEMQATGIYELEYDGVAWQLLNRAAAPFYARTAAEITAGIVPTNYSYPYLHVNRYGAKGDDVNDDTAAIQTALNLVTYAGSPGRGNITGKVLFSACAAYRTTATLYYGKNTILYADGPNATLIDYQGTGVAVAALFPMNQSTNVYIGAENVGIFCSGGAQIGLLLSGGSFMSFKSMLVSGNVKHPVALNQCEVVDFDACRFSNASAGNLSNVWFVNGADLTPALTFTAGLGAAAVNGTLSAPWAGATGLYAIQFVETAGGAAENRLVQLTNASTAATWTVPLVAACNAATTAANSGFTNRITLDRCNFNPTGGYAVLDDGGVCHTISNCNSSGGLMTMRAAGVSALVVIGNEFEAASVAQVQFTDTTLAGAFVGPCEGVVHKGNSYYGNLAIPYIIDIVNLANYDWGGNVYGGYTTAAINLSGPNTSGPGFGADDKAITGNGKTTGPFFDPALPGTTVYRNNFPHHVPVTYVLAPLAAAGIQVITPRSMEFIRPGTRLNCRNPDGTNGETVLVTAVTLNTFTATFATTKNQANWTIRGCTPADQEEGTWSPTLAGSGTAGVNTYAATTLGSYQRRGNMVTFQFAIDITAVDAAMAGALSVNGLPFSAENQINQNAMACVSLFTGFTFAGAYTQLGGFVSPTDNKIQLRKSGSGVATSTIPKTDIAGATCSIYGFGTYFVGSN